MSLLSRPVYRLDLSKARESDVIFKPVIDKYDAWYRTHAPNMNSAERIECQYAINIVDPCSRKNAWRRPSDHPIHSKYVTNYERDLVYGVYYLHRLIYIDCRHELLKNKAVVDEQQGTEPDPKLPWVVSAKDGRLRGMIKERYGTSFDLDGDSWPGVPPPRPDHWEKIGSKPPRDVVRRSGPNASEADEEYQPSHTETEPMTSSGYGTQRSLYGRDSLKTYNGLRDPVASSQMATEFLRQTSGGERQSDSAPLTQNHTPPLGMGSPEIPEASEVRDEARAERAMIQSSNATGQIVSQASYHNTFLLIAAKEQDFDKDMAALEEKEERLWLELRSTRQHLRDKIKEKASQPTKLSEAKLADIEKRLEELEEWRNRVRG